MKVYIQTRVATFSTTIPTEMTMQIAIRAKVQMPSTRKNW